MEKQVCGHPKGDGGACGVDFGLCPECGQCFHHCEHRAAQRLAARRKGGEVNKQRREEEFKQAKFKPARGSEAPEAPETVKDAKEALAWLARAAMTGRIGSSTARDAASVLREFIKAVEVADLESEMAELRAEIKAMRRGGKR